MKKIDNAVLINTSAGAENLVQARLLVSHLESGNLEQADIIIGELCKIRENELFQDIGKVTRDLHETINKFGADTRSNTVTNQEMTDARHDLKYVIDMTEDSANITLNAIEHSVPLLNLIDKRTTSLKERLQLHIKASNNTDKFEDVAAELDAYFDLVIVDMKNIHEDMNKVLLAQSYQDITGQIIQRVSKMVQKVERSLVGILQESSHYMNEIKKTDPIKNNTGYGPSVPGVTGDDVMQNQDDVDQLLSNLGF